MSWVVRAPFYVPRPGYERPWQEPFHRSAPIAVAGLPPPFIPVFWKYDEAPDDIWDARPLRSDIMYILSVDRITPTPKWYFEYFEPSVWQGKPVANWTIRTPPGADDLPPGSQLAQLKWWRPGDERFGNNWPTGYAIPSRMPSPFASYLLLVDHYLTTGYTKAGTVVTEGVELPLNWIPTLAVDPLNFKAIKTYWEQGPHAVDDAEPMRDFYIFVPYRKPQIYWQIVGDGVWQLTGAGAAYGPKRQ